MDTKLSSPALVPENFTVSWQRLQKKHAVNFITRSQFANWLCCQVFIFQRGIQDSQNVCLKSFWQAKWMPQEKPLIMFQDDIRIQTIPATATVPGEGWTLGGALQINTSLQRQYKLQAVAFSSFDSYWLCICCHLATVVWMDITKYHR